MPTRPSVEIAYHSLYSETAPVLARWEDSQYSYNVVPSRNQSSFALVLWSKELDTLAQTTMMEAARLDAEEAPQREIQKQKREKMTSVFLWRRPDREQVEFPAL